MSDSNDIENALCNNSQECFLTECMLCFEDISAVELRGCESCKKEWCSSCDIRWRVTRMSASLLPTCPFCRKRLRLEQDVADEGELIRDQDLHDRLMVAIIKYFSYLFLALVFFMLPLVEAYVTESDEAFLAYLCLVVFIFVFLLCCHLNRGRDEEY